MKKIYALCAAALFLGGCDDETEHYVTPETEPYIETSAARVVFGAGGGEKTVLVATNIEEWEYTAEGDWATIVRKEGELVISASGNKTTENLYATVSLKAGDAQTTFSVAQVAAAQVDDLSATETANCYIAPTDKTLRFRATVKGCGLDTEIGGTGIYIDTFGATIDPTRIVYADLLWEAVFDADKTRSREVIDAQPLYDDGYVYFKTGKEEGNAVIAVKDAQGTILWSWHIWVTDAQMEDIAGNGHLWLDRNIGALTTAQDDLRNRGMLYQWGRKDPFLPSSAPYDPALEESAPEANRFNYQVGDGSGNWVYQGVTAKRVATPPGNLELAVEKPMTMLLFDELSYSWYLMTPNEDLFTAFLWGNTNDKDVFVKSIFDPCPPGYCIPMENPWISATDKEVNAWSQGAGNNGRYWTGGGGAFYPACGYLDGVDKGEMKFCGVQAYYWTSGITPASNRVRVMAFNTSSTLTYTETYQGYAFSARCIRIE